MNIINADIIVIGDSTTGKTCLTLRFVEGHFVEEPRTTLIDFKTRNVPLGHRVVRLRIWDTAGSERFRSPMRSYYRKARGVVIVYDITRRESFENLGLWIDEVNDYCTERTPVKILCGVRLDDEQNRMVSDTEAIIFAARHKMLHCETSAKTGENVDFCFFQLAAKILEKPELCTDTLNVSDTTSKLHVEGPRSQKKDEACC